MCLGSSQNTERFMEMLNDLRDYSETFLRMLNEMRRRLKELRPENPTAQNYRYNYESVVTSTVALTILL